MNFSSDLVKISLFLKEFILKPEMDSILYIEDEEVKTAGWTEEGWDPDIGEWTEEGWDPEAKKPIHKIKSPSLKEGIETALERLRDHKNWELNVAHQFRQLQAKFQEELKKIAIGVPKKILDEYIPEISPIEALIYEAEDNNPIAIQFLKEHPLIIDQAIRTYQKLYLQGRKFWEEIARQNPEWEDVIKYAIPKFSSLMYKYYLMENNDLPRLKKKLGI